MFLIKNCFASSKICEFSFKSYVCENGVVDNINGLSSSLVVENMQIKGVIKGIYGNVHLGKSNINAINATAGRMYIENTTVSGKISGALAFMDLDNSYLKSIHSKVRFVTLSNTEVDKISIFNSEYKMKVSILNHSVVKGNISFIHNSGTVYIDETSNFSGQILNGKLIQISSNNKY